MDNNNVNQCNPDSKGCSSFSFKNVWPYLVAILIFAFIALGYFMPDIAEGKTLFQGDTQQGLAIGHEITQHRQETGETTRWTNSLFSGMPTYQTSPSYGVTKVLYFINDAISLFLPSPAGYLFLMMVGFFILMIVLGMNVPLAVLGALMYTFSSYFLIIIEAGHIWKFVTLAYIPPTIAGILMTYKGKLLSGAALTALFASLQIFYNHVQMTYYFLFVILCLVVGIFFHALKNRQLGKFFNASGALVIAAILAVSVNLSNLYHTYEYSKYTMRGGSELAASVAPSGPAEKSNGLNKDYITQWSYGKTETFSFMIPNIKGGGTAVLGSNPTAMKVAQPQFRQYFNQFNQYWGDQPFTSGPVYVGALVVFLFILALFVVKGWIKYSLLVATILSIILAWGKNFMLMTDIFIDYVPMYNKFRAVSSILVIAEFCIPVLAMLGLKAIIETPDLLRKNMKSLYISFGITAGLCLIFALFPGTFFSFMSDQESQMYLSQASQQPGMMDLLNNLMEGRKAIFTADAWRSAGIITLGALAVYFYAKGKLKSIIMVIIVGVITLFDLVSIDKRYLNSEDFVDKRKMQNPFPMTEIDREILKDQDLHYRVLNLAANTFNDYRTSYYHKSIGGYHAAKLQRYQDIIDYHFSNNLNIEVVNMLNGKYIIVPDGKGGQSLSVNEQALGNAWFVNRVNWVDTPRQEIEALSAFNPATTAVISNKYRNEVGNFAADSTSVISLTGYAPDQLDYVSTSSQPGLAVFSEVFYPGWKAFIDGVETDIIPVDYILRAINVPAGKHEIMFVYKPHSVKTTDRISYMAISVIFAGLLLSLFYFIKRLKKEAE